MLQSLFRPVLRPIMMGVMAVTGSRRAWTPAALWPTGTEAGMWIDPSNLTSQWQDSTGTTPVSTPGTVADGSNPVGLALDIRAGATALADPGLHMLQATSTARPLVSARRNSLTYTEDFSHAVWVSDLGGDATLTKTVAQTDPLGNATAVRLQVVVSSGSASFRYSEGLATEQVIRSAYLKSNTGVGYSMYLGDTLITLDSDTEWHRYDVSESMFSWGFRVQFASSADVTLAFPQRELGTSLSDYQSIPANGSTYAPATPVYQKYDGTDDGMATASFAAGTLSNAMDCMIAVRRDSAVLPSICGLYQVDQTKFFGVVAEEPSNGASTFWNCGSPTIFVDGVSVANTRGALHSAIGVGDWHILEYRDLDLSAWVNAGFGSYGSPYMLNGGQGGILLFPSSTSAADRDAARTWLGAKVGLTL